MAVKNAHSDVVSSFFKTGSPLYFQKGDLILGNQPDPDGVYFVETGFVKVYSINDRGDELIRLIYGQGELFPLAWGYLGVNSELYYEALAETLAWRASQDRFLMLLQCNVEASFAIACQMALQLHIYSGRLENLEYGRSRERVVYRLLFLAGRFGVRRGRRVVITAPITHDIVAKSINLVRESVSREIEKLEAKGIVEHSNRHIIITDLERLRQQLNEPTGLKHWDVD